jgi:MinD-like ATPase involved in chromosome partitioning or flagellar assembly
VLISCWSAKGGAGTTVVAAALAVVLSRSASSGAVLADLAGDLPAALGLAEPTGPGIADWLAAGDDAPADGLARLEVPVRSGLSLLPRGSGLLESRRAEVLAQVLGTDSRPVVVDVGTVGHSTPSGDTGLVLATQASRSLLVLRPCFLALRRAVVAPLRPSGVVLVVEEGRAITADDVEAALGVPVEACVRVTPVVARAVDAGLLAAHLPRSLARDLRHAA